MIWTRSDPDRARSADALCGRGCVDVPALLRDGVEAVPELQARAVRGRASEDVEAAGGRVEGAQAAGRVLGFGVSVMAPLQLLQRAHCNARGARRAAAAARARGRGACGRARAAARSCCEQPPLRLANNCRGAVIAATAAAPTWNQRWPLRFGGQSVRATGAPSVVFNASRPGGGVGVGLRLGAARRFHCCERRVRGVNVRTHGRESTRARAHAHTDTHKHTRLPSKAQGTCNHADAQTDAHISWRSRAA